MTDFSFVIDPAAYGLPTRDELVDMRIWDLHFHGFGRMEEVLPYIDRMAIERLFALGVDRVGGDTPAEKRQREAAERARLAQWQDRVSGIVIIDPRDVDFSLDLMDRWIADGPAVGIKYSGRYRDGVTCSHPNNDPIIERAAELGAVIYIHTWIKVGGDPRYAGGGNFDGESTPSDVALLAARHPDVPLICGHQGGDWELGARAVRPHENVFFEFSGALPCSGAVDFAVKELGVDRIVWGGHGPSRSYANELAKVYDADLTDAERKKVFGRNLRGLAASIFERKGYDIKV